MTRSRSRSRRTRSSRCASPSTAERAARRARAFLLASIVSVAGAETAYADDTAARARFEECVDLHASGDLAGALDACAAAMDTASAPELRAQIARQRGITQSALGAHTDAVVSFMLAREMDGTIKAPGRSPASDLFACAGEALAAGIDAGRVREKHGAAIDAAPVACPILRPSAVTPPESPASTGLEVQGAACPDGSPAPCEDRPALWPIFVSGGVALAATGAASVFGLLTMSRASKAGGADPEDTALGANISWGVAGVSAGVAIVLGALYLTADAGDAAAASELADPL